MALHPTFANLLGAWQSAPRSRQMPQATQDRALENQPLRRGMSLATPRGMKKTQRFFGEQCRVVEYHGGNRATFECKAAGHQFKRQMFPRAPNGKVPCEAMLQKFARYWSQHVNMPCPKCHQ